MVQPERLGQVSFWYADIGGLPARRDPLDGEVQADVCIIGAGYTGLWAAWYLKQHDPGLQVVVIEKEFAGFGASGRNGGWLSGGFAWDHRRYLSSGDAAGVRALVQAMSGTVDEVIAVAEAQDIDADIHRTEELAVATNPAQVLRMREEIAERQRWGEGTEKVMEISGDEVRSRIAIPGVLGAMRVANVARIQPAKLVRGLAAAVERAGVRIVEGTAVSGIAKGAVQTDRGTVRAPVILRCTEGFTATLPGLRRDWLPLNSAQIVTEPVPEDIWREIGWQGAEIVGDFHNSYCYCQRTREGRIAVGGRGLPYRFGSRIDDAGAPDPGTVGMLHAILRRHFPAAAGLRIDHAWCGTLADLALGRQTDLTGLPWVNRRVRRWEPEPLRWLGVRGMYALLQSADRREAGGLARPSKLARIGAWLAGR